VLGFLRRTLNRNALVALCHVDGEIALARVRREKDLPPVLDLCELHPFEGESNDSSIYGRLRKAYDLDRYPCASVMEIGTYNLLLVEAPDVQPSELRAAIRWRIKDLIDFHVDDAVVDVFEVPNQKTVGRNSLMYAVVARASWVKQRIDALTEAGVNLTVVDIPELALRNMASLLPEDVGGVVLLFLDRQSGLITVTRQSILYLSRRIDLGFESFPEGTGEPGTDADIRRRLDRIVVELQRSLDYYESHFSQPAVSSVVIAPLPRMAQGMPEYIGQQLGLSARYMDINQLIDTAVQLDERRQSRCLLAIGAALREEGKEL
jgi:MSHA biogenesis protein MshI